MRTNPCRNCLKIQDDKNNPECRNCQRRLKYVAYLERASGGAGAGSGDCVKVLLPFPTSMSLFG